MSDSSYLLFIDKTPVNDELKNYFAQFNIAILQQDTLTPIHPHAGIPLALLIHWSVLKNNLQTIHQLYTTYPAPLLVIGDHADEEVCIKVLEAGADDFIINPLYPRELHARVSAINRRVMRAQQHPEQEKEIFVFNNWRLYPASRRVFNEDNKQELSLSAGEYDLLLTFVQQPQHVLDRESLLQITKNSDLNPLDRRVDVQISRLRQKIEVDAKKPLLIITIRNGGYMFNAPVLCIKESNLLE
ncbi:winged helix-turn-helix domain-containing protein [Legionella sp.]|uniref:winged helix-turn-helix domain-containing protein n=1 Tax=Legionella sp. TaxID=459 RepID=UPI003C87B39C